MVDETSIRKLVHVKSLYNLANDEFQMGYDTAISRSIVTLDNCIETFFWVILYKKEPNLGPEQRNRRYSTFHKLLTNMKDSKNLEENDLSELHEARNQIQHHGILLSTSQAQQFFKVVENTLYKMTEEFFDIPFDDISLSILINSNKIRQLIHECENRLEKGDFQNAAKKLIIGFELAKLNRQANQFGSGITDKRTAAELAVKKNSHLKDIVKYLTTLDAEIEVMKLGLDYMNWRAYRLLLRTMDPHDYLYDDWELKKELNTKGMRLFEENSDFMEEWVRTNLNFAIESILRWQKSNAVEEGLSPFNIFKSFIKNQIKTENQSNLS